ncbi:MAG: M20/M25/M40 family metallo-hydrolase [Limnochordia bacterium]|jgi:tripeptide aminopeptidase
MVIDWQIHKQGAVWFEERIDEILEQIVKICEIEAPTFAEQARADYVARVMQGLPRGTTTIDDCGNVLHVFREPEAGQGSLLVSAHLDTVFPAGTDVRVRREGERWYAPGIRDNSASVALMIELARFLGEIDYRPRHGLAFVANVGEEGLGNLKGMKYLFDEGLASHWPVGAALVLDGTLGKICYQGVTSRRFEVTITCDGGHSWYNYGRPSAVHALGRSIARIDALRLPTKPRTTLNVGVIEGGVSVNSIAGRARMLIDMRSQESQALDAVDRAVREAIVQATSDDDVHVEIKVVGERPGGSLPEDHPLVRTHAETAAALGVEVNPSWASTDANVPLSKGIPAICIGVARGGALHSPDEYLDTTSVLPGLRYALGALLAFSRWVEQAT